MDVGFRDHCRRTLDQQRQEIERLRRKTHVNPVAKQLTAIGVELETSKAHAHYRSPNFPQVLPSHAPDFNAGRTAPLRRVRLGRDCEGCDGWMARPDIVVTAEF